MLILSKDSPDASLYYLGSTLIKFMLESDLSRVRLSTLYQQFNEYKSLPFSRFMLVLDWLFMIGVITGNEEGEITYVSKRTSN